MARCGFLSAYPPTRCGLANFASALLRSLTAVGCRAGVVRVLDMPATSRPPEVVGYLHSRAPDGHRAAAEALNTFDVALVHHDYDVFGGRAGEQLLAVLDRMRVPVVVVIHDVLDHPTPLQRQMLERIIAASAAVVAMTEVGRAGLVARYGVDPAKVTVIPHGAHRRGTTEQPSPGRRRLILTWGLLRPGKGIEWAIDGLRQLKQIRPRPAYIVAGQTHPRAREQHGEAYRLHLGERARAVGVSDIVRFAGTYLDEAVLTQLVRRADVVLLPYDSRDQVSSGVLVEAVAAGRPVVATAFPHAVELLSSGAGLLVPRYDGAAIGAALERVLTEPGLAEAMTAEAARLAPALLWPAVAERYRSLFAQVLAHRSTVST